MEETQEMPSGSRPEADHVGKIGPTGQLAVTDPFLKLRIISVAKFIDE
jgi:hypothetical protein